MPARVPSSQWLAIVAEHGAEADVLELHVGAEELHHRKELLEMKTLAVVDDVERPIGVEMVLAVLDSRNVGRRVEKRAVLFSDDERRLLFAQ